MTLQQSFNKEVVRKQLQEVLLTARHNDAVEREVPETQIHIVCFTLGNLFGFLMVSVFCVYQGVAIGVGLCANSHLEGTLAKLDEFGKSDAFKKSPSIFNLLKVQRAYIWLGFLLSDCINAKRAWVVCLHFPFPLLRSVMMWRWRRWKAH